MLKYRLDNVSPDSKAGSVVYVKVYDDSAPDVILTSLCVPYVSKEQFEGDLQAKTQKYLDSVAGREVVAGLAVASFAAVEGKINEVQK